MWIGHLDWLLFLHPMGLFVEVFLVPIAVMVCRSHAILMGCLCVLAC